LDEEQRTSEYEIFLNVTCNDMERSHLVQPPVGAAGTMHADATPFIV